MRAKVNSNSARVTSIIGEVPKRVFTLGDCKGVIEPSAPRRFRMWVLIEDLNIGTEVWADSIEDGKSKLIEQINNLRAVVPARRAAFERLEFALRLKFPVLRHGYEYLNRLQNRWRESSTERLIELTQTVEALGTPENPETIIENHTPVTARLSGDFCPECGRPSFNGKIHLRCEYEAQQKKRGEPTASTGLTAGVSKSKDPRPSSSKFTESDNAPYLKQGSNSTPKREFVGNISA